MKTSLEGIKKNSKKAPFEMKPSHLELGWVHFGWAALPNAAFPSPSVLHKSTEGWKPRESGNSTYRLNSGKIYSTERREEKKQPSVFMLKKF